MKKIILAIVVLAALAATGFSDEKKTHVEVSFSINWTFGCYKEMTFANISQSILSPRFQLDTKIFSGSDKRKPR